MKIFCLFLLSLSVLVGAPKRSRDEFEISESFPDIPNLLDSLAGRSGRGIDLIKAGRRSYVVEKLLALRKFEVEAFQIIQENPDTTLAEIVDILNTRITIDRRISMGPFTHLHVRVWREAVINSSNSELAEFVKTDSHILTYFNGVQYIELSERIWDKFIFPFLIQTVERYFPPTQMVHLRKPLLQSEAEGNLTPLAREYIHQQMRIEEFTGSFERFPNCLRPFNTESILFRRLLDYYVSTRSLGLIDKTAAEYLRQHPDVPMSSWLAVHIGKLFGSNHRPAMRVMYDGTRLRSLYKLAPWNASNELSGSVQSHGDILFFNQENMNKLVLDPLRIPNQPESISAMDVIREWETLEREQVLSGSIGAPVYTGIRGKKFNPNFELVSGTLHMTETIFLSIEVQIRVINYALELSAKEPLDFFVRNGPTVDATLRSLAMESYSNPAMVAKFFREVVSTRFVEPEIARELCRINKLQISTDALSILQDARNRGIQSFMSTPQSVVDFYNTMLACVSEKVLPFSIRFHQSLGEIAVHDLETWKKYSVLPKLNELKKRQAALSIGLRRV